MITIRRYDIWCVLLSSVHCLHFLSANRPRIQTARLLFKIDPSIVDSYLQHFIGTIPSPTKHSLAVCENYASRAIELSDVVDIDGANYAKRVVAFLHAIQTPREDENKGRLPANQRDPAAEKQAGWGTGARAVLESAVELVLTRLRDGENSRKKFCQAPNTG